MSQKFVGLEDAASQLGVSKDRLNELREAGKLRAYRDGASWKFRSEEIEKLAQEGLPAMDSSISDLALLPDAEEEAEVSTEPTAAAPEDSELDLAGEESAADAAASDLQLEEIDEPTVPVEPAEDASDTKLKLDADEQAEDASDTKLKIEADEDEEEENGPSDSILLSETELGESAGRPPSTIIGKAELDPEGDLNLAVAGEEGASASDASPPAPGSDVLATGEQMEDALDLEPPSPSESFEDLEELEIDLEAESSRVLSPGDVLKAKEAAEASAPEAVSDLELEASQSSDMALADISVEEGPGATGSGLGIAGSSPIALEADEDDEQVLGDGSDITLSSESSGINIVSPSDSGLALDEVPLDLSGASALGSSLDLGSSLEEEVDLGALGVGEEQAAPAAEEEPFALTPIGEEAADEEEDSSQVIALDEVSEEEGAGPLLEEEVAAAPVLSEDLGALGLTAGPMVAAEPTVDTPFSLANVLSLSFCLLLLAICGMMTYDLLRNMWSWDGIVALNSSILQILNPFLN